MNYFKHHIGDYDACTAHLSWVEDMAYTRLMRLYYRREAPIPADVADACRLVRAKTKPEKDAVAAVLSEFFTLESDGWHNHRCDEEIAAVGSKADANRENGKKGGRPKRTVTQIEPTNNPDGFQTVTHEKGTPRLQDSKTPSESGFAASGDTRKGIFDLGKSILGASSGSLISEAIKRTSEAEVGSVLGAMAVSTKADPRAYFVKSTTPKQREVVV